MADGNEEAADFLHEAARALLSGDFAARLSASQPIDAEALEGERQAGKGPAQKLNVALGKPTRAPQRHADRKRAKLRRPSPTLMLTIFINVGILLIGELVATVVVHHGTADTLGAETPTVSSRLTTAATPTHPPPPPLPSNTAGFGQPVMATPSGYSASNLIMDDRFQGTSLDTSHWSDVMGGPAPDVGPWGHYTGTPVVNNGLTLTNANGTASMVDTANPATGKNLFTFPANGFYAQVNLKVTNMSDGFFPGIWFPFDDGLHYNANEIDMFEGGFLPSNYGLSGHPVDNLVESNYGGCPCEDLHWEQVVVDSGEDITRNFVTVGVEYVPGNHLNYYLGQGGTRRLIFSDTNASNIGAFAGYNMVITPQGTPWDSSVWHTQGAGTGSMYVAEVQVYSLPW
jgi:hypothetical protein